METAIVVLIVVLTVLYLFRRFLRKRRTDGICSGCGSCSIRKNCPSR